MRNKAWWESKTVWGILGFTVFGIINQYWPAAVWVSLITASLGWAGYGLRDAL